MGGVVIDLRGKTGVPGLKAVGNVDRGLLDAKGMGPRPCPEHCLLLPEPENPRHGANLTNPQVFPIVQFFNFRRLCSRP